MTPNDFLELKGYGKDGHVTRSRKLICELLNEYAILFGNLEYNDAIEDAMQFAEVEFIFASVSGKDITDLPQPEIVNCKVNRDSILQLKRK
jgi:hypothetical protein